MRSSGILLHISSLPSPYGIGTMGKAAYEFADFLHSARQRYWQLLPIGPTSYGDSPYQSFSTFAGNPYFIDLDLLLADELLTADELLDIDWGDSSRVDYELQYAKRLPLLRSAFARGWTRDPIQIAQFRDENPWLEDYALFMAIKHSRNMQPWYLWPQSLRTRRRAALEKCRAALSEDVNFFVYLQFLFYRQWSILRGYVNGLGICLIGDLPIYVPYDSCDVWANPKLFQLDKDGKPTGVAGCPPDYFSADGQLWGNPLYNWKAMKKDDYAWWKLRIKAAARLFDVTRIDHFRGLESYYAVPFGAETAREGHWEKGPGEDFIRALHSAFPNLQLIAEDLGFLTDEVRKLLAFSGFPGMKVLEFAFDSREPSNYLPHRYERNCICYTGTHDNAPLAAWWESVPPSTRDYAAEYLAIGENPCRAFLRAGMASVADTFVAQMQDYLELGEESRMNTPGTLGSQNWTWRLAPGSLKPELTAWIRQMTYLYER
ncbi:MAG: 4-alpha-glucanotransferase [Oscillospiraceae bacterium]|nr:4-alpha-glucanotransferase [Oscillospiraceae bacterium]